MIARLAGALAVALATAAAAQEPIPLEDFLRLPQYADMRLSPDGKHIAALAPVRGRQNLVLLDLKSRKAQPVTNSTDVDIVHFEWLNDRRLLVYTGYLGEVDADRRLGALLAIDYDGKDPVYLVWRPSSFLRPWTLSRTLPGTDDVMISEIRGTAHRLDTRTGRVRAVGTLKPESGDREQWLFDSQGVARGFVAYDNDKRTASLFYRAGENAEWMPVETQAYMKIRTWPLGADADALYVTARGDGDTAAIYRWSASKRALGDRIAAHPRVDLRHLVFDGGRAVGVAYEDDQPEVEWFDEELARVQKGVDAALPGRANRLSWSHDRKLFLVFSSSDTAPGSFYLLDAATGKLEWLADRMPWIQSARLSPRVLVRYKARDGLEIPAYLTIPKGQGGKPLPMVLIAHGGPWVREVGGFNSDAQLLASRGYVVLEPNFRGSTGYGWKHLSAGFKQWGRAMQDDLTDGVRWAVEQGIADPKRICIYGASYGGYAAMMGLAKTPELFRCAVNYLGVTDLPTLFKSSWFDFVSSELLDNFAREMVAESADRATLEAISPARLAGRMRGAVLMAYGSADQRVPLEHGTLMKDALEKAGHKPEWMVMEGEGHGFRKLENRLTYYRAVERFLAEHLK